MNPQKKERIHGFLRAFLPALTNAHQYTITHQLAISSIETAYGQLIEAIGRDLTLPIVIVEDRIVVNEEPLEDSIYNNRFIQFFKSRGIQHIRVNHGITQDELTSFVTILTAGPAPSGDRQILPHIQFGKVGLGFKKDDEGRENAAEAGVYETDEGQKPGVDAEEDGKTSQIRRYFETISEKELGLMENVYDAVKRDQSLPELEIREAVTDIITAIKRGTSVLMAFSPLRMLDEYTFTHSTNVCILTIAQALALKMRDELLHDMGIAAMLHDIGKIFVPEEVLNKPGKLTGTERELIKQHPQKGAEYLIDQPGIPPLAIIVAYEHHMLYDYSGYPKVSNNWRQNICSQMTTVADIFDALRTKRIYRDSLETKIIADELTKMATSSLHPVLTKNFLLLLKKLTASQES